MENRNSKKKFRYAQEKKQKLRRRHRIIVCSSIAILGALTAAVAIPVGVFQSLSVHPDAAAKNPPHSAVSAASQPEPKLSSSAPPTDANASGTGSTASKASGASSEANSSNSKAPGTGKAYESLYPNLYASKREKMHVLENSEKVVYLTFDDGPSDLTAPLLDVLQQYDAKATFFNCRQSDYQDKFSPMMKRCVDEGHVVAVHSYSHKMHEVYASVESFLDDFNKMYEHIRTTTGKEPANFFRFPGGSKNGYNQKVYQEIIQEMTRRGFIYYDWDGDSGDASGNSVSGSLIYNNTMDAIHRGCNVILMHNVFGKQTTLDQVGKIIRDAQKEGYVFKALDGTLDPTHGYLMTNKEFIPAAIQNNIPLSDWRMNREKTLP